MPPFRHSGFRASPTWARPVPFCRHGFLPVPLTIARVFVACVPRRSAALAWTTDSWIKSVFTRPPNTSSRRSSEPTFSFCWLTTSTVMVLLLALLLHGLGLRDLDRLGRNRLANEHYR